MAAIQKIIDINKRELDANVSDSASWHADYRDTSYIYVGYLPPELQEKDIVAIFSQYGNPTHIHLVRDRETGKSRGFCYLKYEDVRSCVLAIDNFNGVQLLNKRIKVDHVYYKLREGQKEDDFKVHYDLVKEIEPESDKKLLEYKDNDTGILDKATEDANDEFKDPMEAYIAEKKQTEKKPERHRHKDRSKHSHRKRHEDSHVSRHKDNHRKRSRSPTSDH